MTLWLSPNALVLASKSESRRAMLIRAGLRVEADPADIDERALEDAARNRTSRDTARMLAAAKAADVSGRHPGRMVLGADSVLALGDERFHKPPDRAAARRQLLALRGRTHEIVSGFALVQDGGVVFEGVDVARLTMRDFSERFLDRYLDEAGDAVLGSVGAYQLERLGVHLFARIEGDFTTILGLPLLPVLAYLRVAGLVAD